MTKNNQKKSVLIVDDDQSLQDILLDKLNTQGLLATAVATGVDALHAVKTNKPDLVLLDIMLQGNLNGFDVLEELKKGEDSRHIPVIVLTNLEGEQKSALNVGAIDYIVKTDVAIDDIVLKIKNVVNTSGVA